MLPSRGSRFSKRATCTSEAGTPTVKLDLNAKQALCLRYLEDDITDIICYGGAGGGGKSWVSAIFCWLQMQKYSGIRIGVCRKQLVDLKSFTTTFFKVVSYYKDDPKKYKSSQSGIINTLTGSEIVYKALIYLPTDPNFDRLGSLELTHCILEEGQELSKEAWDAVRTRTGRQLNRELGIKPKKLITCNPRICWIYDYYKKRNDPFWTIENQFIEAKSDDNLEFLPQDYLEGLMKVAEENPLQKARILEGRWDYADLEENKVLSSVMVLNSLTISKEEGPIKIGIDIGGCATWSDRTTVCVLDGNEILPPYIIDSKSFTGSQYMYDDWLSDRIIEIIEGYHIDNFKDVRLDACGMGASVYELLRKKGYPIFAFRGDSKPIPRRFHTTSEYLNLRAQSYFELKEKFRLGKLKLSLSYSDDMVDELAAAKYYIAGGGKIALEEKVYIRRRLGRSPDFADALSMAALDLGTSGTKSTTKVKKKKSSKVLESFSCDLDDPTLYKTT